MWAAGTRGKLLQPRAAAHTRLGPGWAAARSRSNTATTQALTSASHSPRASSSGFICGSNTQP